MYRLFLSSLVHVNLLHLLVSWTAALRLRTRWLPGQLGDVQRPRHASPQLTSAYWGTSLVNHPALLPVQAVAVQAPLRP